MSANDILYLNRKTLTVTHKDVDQENESTIYSKKKFKTIKEALSWIKRHQSGIEYGTYII